jgi:hypothetical protein
MIFNFLTYSYEIDVVLHNTKDNEMFRGSNIFKYDIEEPYNLIHLFKKSQIKIENTNINDIEVHFSNNLSNFVDYINNNDMKSFLYKNTLLYRQIKDEENIFKSLLKYMLDTSIIEESNDNRAIYININHYGKPDMFNFIYSRWIDYVNITSIRNQSEYKGYLLVNTTNDAMYNIEIIEYDDLELYNMIFFVFGLILYITSPLLSSSLYVYLSGCFIFGSLFSILTILILFLYLISKQVKLKNWVSSSLFCGLILVGGKWSIKTLSSWKILIQNYYFLLFILIGGIIGFLVGYKKELNDKNKFLLNIMIKFVGIFMIIYTIQMYEISFLILFMCSSIIRWFTYITIRKLMSITILSTRSKAKYKKWLSYVYKPKRKLISNQEYENQSSEYTNEKLKDLQDYYTKNPSRLNLLNMGRQNTKRFISGPL